MIVLVTVVQNVFFSHFPRDSVKGMKSLVSTSAEIRNLFLQNTSNYDVRHIPMCADWTRQM